MNTSLRVARSMIARFSWLAAISCSRTSRARDKAPTLSSAARYARAYAEWAAEAMQLLLRTKGQTPRLAYPFKVFPLRVLKQIVAMFFSVNSPSFRDEVPYLVQFVLDKRTTGLPPDIRILAAYTAGPQSRSAGKSGLLAEVGGNPQAYAVSEITFPPFVFVMTLASPSPDQRLLDISPFASYGYDERRELYLSLPVLAVNAPYPTDYRPVDEVVRAAAMHQAL